MFRLNDYCSREKLRYPGTIHLRCKGNNEEVLENFKAIYSFKFPANKITTPLRFAATFPIFIVD